jgi:hypothetical protein
VNESLGRVAAGGFARVLVAGFVLVLAGLVVTISGGTGFGGRLGSLFGFGSSGHAKRAPVAFHTPRAAAAPVLVARSTPHRSALRPHTPKRSAPVRIAPQRRSPAAQGQPAPATPPVAPAPPPVEIPRPVPAPSGNVERTTEAVRDITAPTVPAATPVVDAVAGVTGQVCSLIGGCP